VASKVDEAFKPGFIRQNMAAGYKAGARYEHVVCLPSLAIRTMMMMVDKVIYPLAAAMDGLTIALSNKSNPISGETRESRRVEK
jgi:hypothetical protein